MRKQSVLKWINILLFVLFLSAFFSMILYKWGPESFQGSEVVYEIHELSGIFFFVLAACHFILNFQWVKNTYFKEK